MSDEQLPPIITEADFHQEIKNIEEAFPVSNNVIEMRPNLAFKVGDRVCIGDATSVFTINRLGSCKPPFDEIGGKFINAHEFVCLNVPAMTGRVFEVHVEYLRHADE